jgi:hypothetical protein
MLGWFALESTSDSIRVLTAVSEVSSVKELVAASSNIRSKLRNVTTQLKPSNVYEDLSRTKIVVTMVFVTQCLLIAFVVRPAPRLIPRNETARRQYAHRPSSRLDVKGRRHF